MDLRCGDTERNCKVGVQMGFLRQTEGKGEKPIEVSVKSGIVSEERKQRISITHLGM